jgi:hypothetical protein
MVCGNKAVFLASFWPYTSFNYRLCSEKCVKEIETTQDLSLYKFREAEDGDSDYADSEEEFS